MTPLPSWKRPCLFSCFICLHLHHQLIWSLPHTHWWLHSLARRIHVKSHHHPEWLQCLWRDSANCNSHSLLTISSQITLIASLLYHPYPGLKSGLINKDEKFKYKSPDSNTPSHPSLSHWFVLTTPALDSFQALSPSTFFPPIIAILPSPSSLSR